MLFLPFKKGERDIVLKISKMVEFYVFFLKLYKKTTEEENKAGFGAENTDSQSMMGQYTK